MRNRRVRVVDCETREHRRVRLGRERLVKALHEMIPRLEEYRDDPAVMLLMRCGALALELFSAHPVDKRGRCKRHGYLRVLGRSTRPCPTLCRLMFYSDADVGTVWWRLLAEFEGRNMSLAAVRDWLKTGAVSPGSEHAGAHTGTPTTGSAGSAPTTPTWTRPPRTGK